MPIQRIFTLPDIGLSIALMLAYLRQQLYITHIMAESAPKPEKRFYEQVRLISGISVPKGDAKIVVDSIFKACAYTDSFALMDLLMAIRLARQEGANWKRPMKDNSGLQVAVNDMLSSKIFDPYLSWYQKTLKNWVVPEETALAVLDDTVRVQRTGNGLEFWLQNPSVDSPDLIYPAPED